MPNTDEFFENFENYNEEPVTEEKAVAEEPTETATTPRQAKTSFSEAAYGTKGFKTHIEDLVGKTIDITGITIKDSKFEDKFGNSNGQKKYVTLNYIDENGHEAYVNTGSKCIYDQVTEIHKNGLVKNASIVEQFAADPTLVMTATIVQRKSKTADSNGIYHKYFALQ